MTEKSSAVRKPRPRGRTTANIIRAAKEAGAASVTFPDGTVVTMAREDEPKTVLLTAPEDAPAS